MNIGDLIKWVDADMIQYVPVYSECIGIIIKKGCSGPYEKAIFVISLDGRERILSEHNETIEVINENR